MEGLINFSLENQDLLSVELLFYKEKNKKQLKATFLHADDVILMMLLVSWRPLFGRLVFYYIFMNLCALSPSSLRSHNASVMFCQVRHDGSRSSWRDEER